MGILQWQTNYIEIFNNLEIILNKTSLSLINIDLKRILSEEEKDNYIFICSIINYYQSLKNNKNKKYFYYFISYKTKNISSFLTPKKAKELFLNWSKLLYKTHNNNYILDNKEIETNQIKKEILNSIQQNQLLNIFIENFNNYYNNLNNKSFIKLILSGLPDFLRPFIWKIILEKKNKNNKRVYMKEYLTEKNNNNQNLKQIYKDINRTFIEKIDEEKINKLKNVLIALSNYNYEIGYTQGMNNIIGFLLKVTKFDEEKTFNLAILIMDKIKGYFTKDFPLLKQNLLKFNTEFTKRNTKLYKHLKKLDIPDELWISKWIQTLFTINFPFDEVCRIWDSLIVFGFDFIIYLSLSIIYYAEEELLKLNDSSDIINYLKEIMNPIPNMEKMIIIEPNYKDYIIPIYNIISKAKKIKREIFLEISYYNSMKNNINSLKYFYDNEMNEYNSNKLNYNYSNSGLIKNNKNEIIEKNKIPNLKSLKSSSSEIILKNNINKLSILNQKKDDKIIDNKNEKLLIINKYNKLKKNNFLNVNNNNKSYNEIKKKCNYSTVNINNNKQNDNNNNILRKFSNFSDINNYNYKIMNNNKLDNNMTRKYSDAIDTNNYSYQSINNIYNAQINNNYIKKETSPPNFLEYKNSSPLLFNNLNLNENNKRDYVNGRPRRNMKILVHKKVNLFVSPMDKTSIIRNRSCASKSPEYFRPQPLYPINNNINNIRYGYIQNTSYDNNNNNNYINTQKRGSYNISLPLKYCYGYQILSK